MSNKTISITSIDDLKRYNQGEVVELPEFASGMPFVARLKRPSLLFLAKIGKIPNSLLPFANELFYGVDRTKRDNDALQKTFEVIEIMCEAAFVEPSYADIRANGIQLTDQQYLAVFNYTQQGVLGLSSFRQK